MKSIKIIGIAVATLGVAASIGGAIALYTKQADNVELIIGAGTHTGSTSTLEYRINGSKSPTVNPVYWDGTKGDGTGLSPKYKEIKYEFTLGADFASPLVKQDYVLGNLTVSLTNVPEAQRGFLSVWAEVQNYGSGTLGAANYATFMEGGTDYAITTENQSFVRSNNICVATDGVQKLVLYLKYSEAFFTANDQLTKNEAGLGYKLDITWGSPSNDFDIAYVSGDQIAWAEDGEFAMYPNINKAAAEGFEWMYKGLTGWSGEAKCVKKGVYSGGSNAQLTATKTYDIYWNGSKDTAANFAARS